MGCFWSVIGHVAVRELYWERDMERLAGQLGTVQCDDPETGMTAARLL